GFGVLLGYAFLLDEVAGEIIRAVNGGFLRPVRWEFSPQIPDCLVAAVLMAQADKLRCAFFRNSQPYLFIPSIRRRVIEWAASEVVFTLELDGHAIEQPHTEDLIVLLDVRSHVEWRALAPPTLRRCVR